MTENESNNQTELTYDVDTLAEQLYKACMITDTPLFLKYYKDNEPITKCIYGYLDKLPDKCTINELILATNNAELDVPKNIKNAMVTLADYVSSVHIKDSTYSTDSKPIELLDKANQCIRNLLLLSEQLLVVQIQKGNFVENTAHAKSMNEIIDSMFDDYEVIDTPDSMRK